METGPRKIDKTKWGPGPWQDEPDRVEFKHAGLSCLMVRQPEAGHWCGYVAVPPGHPWHGRDYGSKWDENYDKVITEGVGELVSVHGGLTYAAGCQGSVCHVPASGEPDNVWWLGFDCAHSGDERPGDAALLSDAVWNSFTGARAYRDQSYVRREVKSLAEQVAAHG